MKWIVLSSSVLLLVIMDLTAAAIWQENIRPKMYITADDLAKHGDTHTFMAKNHNESRPELFRLIIRDGNNLLLGGRNYVHNLTLSSLTEIRNHSWFTDDTNYHLCVMKGKTEEECNNFVRILTISPKEMIVCGTNAYKPLCRGYKVKPDSYEMVWERNGQALSPYDPLSNSTSVMIDEELFSGSVTDFRGIDSIIYRDKLQLQTEPDDSTSLNAPNFVGSLDNNEHVYFFFRETAVESLNRGKAVYSRVGRVCKNDRGGPQQFRNRWTSYLKSRLNCSVPGEFPFYFDEIQSSSQLVIGEYEGQQNQKVIYAVFTTSINSIPGSAVCAYSIQSIEDTFEGLFKEQESLNTNWLSVPAHKVPVPRPGSCVNDSKVLSDQVLNFIKHHPIMCEAVPAMFGEPILISTGFQHRFTQITVDPQVKTPGHKFYDVLFIGTDNGKVLKAINANSFHAITNVSSVIIEEIQVFGTNEPVRSLRIFKTTVDNETVETLIALSDSKVKSFKLSRCYEKKSCSECVELQDPYCAWDTILGKCTSASSPEWTNENLFYQNVQTGEHHLCPST